MIRSPSAITAGGVLSNQLFKCRAFDGCTIALSRYLTDRALFALKDVQSKPSFTRVFDASTQTPACRPSLETARRDRSLMGRLRGHHHDSDVPHLAVATRRVVIHRRRRLMASVSLATVLPARPSSFLLFYPFIPFANESARSRSRYSIPRSNPMSHLVQTMAYVGATPGTAWATGWPSISRSKSGPKPQA